MAFGRKNRTERILSVVLAFGIFAMSSCNHRVKEPPETGSVDSETDSAASEPVSEKATESERPGSDMEQKYLANSLYKLRNDRKLTVGFFGGSVTYGTGATDRESGSWRALTRNWLKSSFPKADITEVNAAIGNTGSVFGVYRIDTHYIKDRAPDLNFIELAINDSIDFLNGNRVSDTDENNVYIETIVRKIYASNPSADIVFVLTGNYERLKSEAEGGEIFGEKYISIGNYYDIPVVRCGTAMAEFLSEKNGGSFPGKENNQYPQLWFDYYKDNVHPADTGHYIYAKTVRSFLSEWMTGNFKPTGVTDKALPEKTYCETNGYGSLMMDACMVSPGQFKGTDGLGGFKIVSNDNGLMPYSLISETDGDEIVLTFHAKSIAIWTLAPKTADQTKILCSIDGGAETEFEIVYNSGSRNNKVFLLAEGLSDGTHTIRIKHIGEKPLDIRYFLLHGISESGSPLNVVLQK